MYRGGGGGELGLVHTYQQQSTAQVLCDSRPAAHEGAQDQLQGKAPQLCTKAPRSDGINY